MFLERDKVFDSELKGNSWTTRDFSTAGLKAWTSLSAEIIKAIPNFCLPGQHLRSQVIFPPNLLSSRTLFSTTAESQLRQQMTRAPYSLTFRSQKWFSHCWLLRAWNTHLLYFQGLSEALNYCKKYKCSSPLLFESRSMSTTPGDHF